jgi:hypothetical protein
MDAQISQDGKDIERLSTEMTAMIHDVDKLQAKLHREKLARDASCDRAEEVNFGLFYDSLQVNYHKYDPNVLFLASLESDSMGTLSLSKPIPLHSRPSASMLWPSQYRF